MVSIKGKRGLIRKPSTLKSRLNAQVNASKSGNVLPTAQLPQATAVRSEAQNLPTKSILSGRNRVPPRPSKFLSLRKVSQQRLDRLISQSRVIPVQTPKLNKRRPVLSGLAEGRIGSVVRRSFQRLLPSRRSLRRRKGDYSLQSLLGNLRNRPEDHGDICSLQSMLGLRGAEDSVSNVTFLSLDLEWRTSNGFDRITEIGISVLNAKQIRDAAFGPYGQGWFARMQHHHIAIGRPAQLKRMAASLFASTRRLQPVEARNEISRIIASLYSDDDPGHLVIVGQSVEGDIQKLRDDPLYSIDMRECSGTKMPFHSVVDTLDLARAARLQGTNFVSLRLAGIARKVGIDPRYWTNTPDVFGNPSALVGVHNASNDAAYALMTALLMGMRWNDLVGSENDRILNERLWDTSRGTRLPKDVAARKLSSEEHKMLVRAEKSRRWRTHRDRRRVRTELESELGEVAEIERPTWLQWIKSFFTGIPSQK
ncbi:hypothetical protein HII31_07553 [Pseudocercospora fuligena]|uniref:Gfd2/YDR514C-like C-terminal domain-containing protein n=1 Tax=Pseudocercospora fuligena TaxID=685502 RepID=A0A8H6RHG3_9PEZI|nr:hypothetical protein HII31_07553 [Pseudocercospora fuligena]